LEGKDEFGFHELLDDGQRQLFGNECPWIEKISDDLEDVETQILILQHWNQQWQSCRFDKRDSDQFGFEERKKEE